MKQWFKHAAWILAQVVIANLPAQASEIAPNPYAIIAERNVFRLTPSPPESTGATVQTAALAGLTLTGVAQIGADKFALLTKAHGQATLCYVLRIGQHEDDLEVLSIDVKAGIASVRLSGVEGILSLAAQRRTEPQIESAEENIFERRFQFGEPRPDGV